MKSELSKHLFCACTILALSTTLVAAGPYIPGGPTGEPEYISYSDSRILGWATGITVNGYAAGTHVVAPFDNPSAALGPADPASTSDVVSLGRGGAITLTFDAPISNGPGVDFAVFENGFDIPGQGRFSELAYVEVASADTFIRFPNISLTPSPVTAFGTIDPTDIFGLAGKAPLGQGTAFDLDIFSAASLPDFDINAIRYVRIVDIIGDGRATDSIGNPIYDPFPTVDSAGFDLEAVAVLNQGSASPPPPPEEPPALTVDVPIPLVTWLLPPLLVGLGALRSQATSAKRLRLGQPSDATHIWCGDCSAWPSSAGAIIRWGRPLQGPTSSLAAVCRGHRTPGPPSASATIFLACLAASHPSGSATSGGRPNG